MHRRWFSLGVLVAALTIAAMAGLWIASGWANGPEDRSIRFTAAAATESLESFPQGEKPLNVILVIADGLGFSHLAAGRARLAGLEGRLFVERFPAVGWQMTWAYQDLITDSAASATSMATGHKVGNRAISRFKGKNLRTVLEKASEKGMHTGLVTDSYLWDATPAAFVTHVNSRGHSEEIRAQMAVSEADLLVGTRGHRRESIEPESAEGRAVQTQFEAEGWTVHWQWRQDPTDDAKSLFLLPADSIATESQEPQLSDLASLATERLQNEAGFFLMIESEEMDTASHANDFERVVSGMAKVDAAVKRLVEFVQQDRRTLIVVTSDHETGGLAVTSGKPGERVGHTWATSRHTAEAVPIFAYGPSAEHFTGVLDNTDIARRIDEVLELGLF